jgi:hypothetical protein
MHAISAFQSSEFKPCSWRGVLDTTLCDKVCQWLVAGRWFSLGTSVSSTNKTGHHDVTEILLKVALNTINQNQTKFNSQNTNRPMIVEMFLHYFNFMQYCDFFSLIIYITHDNSYIEHTGYFCRIVTVRFIGKGNKRTDWMERPTASRWLTNFTPKNKSYRVHITYDYLKYIFIYAYLNFGINHMALYNRVCQLSRQCCVSSLLL